MVMVENLTTLDPRNSNEGPAGVATGSLDSPSRAHVWLCLQHMVYKEHYAGHQRMPYRRILSLLYEGSPLATPSRMRAASSALSHCRAAHS